MLNGFSFLISEFKVVAKWCLCFLRGILLFLMGLFRLTDVLRRTSRIIDSSTFAPFNHTSLSSSNFFWFSAFGLTIPFPKTVL
jgi:hypothetical protein